MTETQLQKAIMDALQKMGVWVIRTAVSRKRGRGFTGEPGMPDLWTEHCWIEVKLPGKKLEPDQVAWHAKAKARGIKVGTAWSIADAYGLVKAFGAPSVFWARKITQIPVTTDAEGIVTGPSPRRG